MESRPRLEKPGAGLPLIEGLLVKYRFYPAAMRVFSWEGSLRQLREETENIIALVQPLTEEKFHAPVLIDRLTGLEDSSRFWSAAMTMEHLMITVRGMTEIAATLAAGLPVRDPPGTAAVKPTGENLPARDAMVEAFRQLALDSIATLAPFAAATASDRCKARHPFFGPIPAKGWVFVLGAHQKLHRVQIERIIRGL